MTLPRNKKMEPLRSNRQAGCHGPSLTAL